MLSKSGGRIVRHLMFGKKKIASKRFNRILIWQFSAASACQSALIGMTAFWSGIVSIKFCFEEFFFFSRSNLIQTNRFSHLRYILKQKNNLKYYLEFHLETT